MTNEFYVNQLSKIYEGPAWFGESFAEKLKAINEEQAFKKPSKDIHSIAELLSHIIYWRMALITILEGKLFTHTTNSPENWRSNEELEALGWQALLLEFEESQTTITELLLSTPDGVLKQVFRGKSTVEDIIMGVMHHDVYHLGQIGLVYKSL